MISAKDLRAWRRLSEMNMMPGGGAVIQLLDEVERLRVENERARKVIGAAQYICWTCTQTRMNNLHKALQEWDRTPSWGLDIPLGKWEREDE